MGIGLYWRYTASGGHDCGPNLRRRTAPVFTMSGHEFTTVLYVSLFNTRDIKQRRFVLSECFQLYCYFPFTL